ncbi:glutamyl aminopeptidase-like isoform X2 [Bolinopsis microptera]|uniref:glutamyl aminopeptidase-like isoform X2 n=1 Tax=Bolinopsis microptera TaxID=2820187 RepID=UPI00307A6150
MVLMDSGWRVLSVSYLLVLSLVVGDISDVDPERYTLMFSVYPETGVFTGSTDIQFSLLTDTRELTLNSKDLNIVRALIYKGKERENIPVIYTLNDKEELVLTRTDEKRFRSDSYFLRMQYRAELKRELNGIYLTEYKTEDGEVHPIVATHFEPTHARKAFPCFDQPQLKSEFTVMVDHPTKFRVISNMPKSNDRVVRSATIRSEFLPTPAMSTYLVAFVMSDLEETTVRTNRGVAISVYNRPGKRQATKTGIETVRQSVEFFENYLGRVFPLPKLDVVPLPDFAIGGMENWGLITIREDMFYTDNDTPPESIILTRAILAHEVAHMWFGDLVSITSWNNLWLKEGAANMLMYPAIEQLITKNTHATVSDIKNSLLQVSRYPALDYDSVVNTHPVAMNISDPAEAAAAFDAISYSKSAALLDMLRSAIGDDRFRAGVGKYVREFQYGSASLEDFLKTMDTTGPVYRNVKISDFMRSWLTKTGYPVVSVTKLNNRKYRLSQYRFINKPNFKDNKTVMKRWPVMITLRTERRKVYKFMMNGGTKIVSFNYDPGFIKLNINSTMFIRVNYDLQSITGIAEQLEADHERYFTEDDRAGLVSDVITMATVNKCPMSYAMNMIRYLPKETSYMVWDQALSKISSIAESLSNRTKPLFNTYMKDLITKASVLKQTDSISSGLLSNLLSYYGVVYRIPEAVQRRIQTAKDLLSVSPSTTTPTATSYQGEDERADEEFATWEKDTSYQVTSAVLTYGVAELGKEEKLWEKLESTSYPHNQEYYRSLSATKNPETVTRLLEGSLKYDWVPLQNKYDILNSVSGYHPAAAFKFLKENYDTFYELYGETQFNFGNILHTVVGNLKTRQDLEEATTFLESQKLGTGERAFRIAVDEVSSVLDWRDCCEEDLRDYLLAHPTSN